MKPDEIEFLIELVRIRAGYTLDGDKTYLMESRLSPVARREGFSSIRDLLMTTKQRRDDRLAWVIVEAVVCGETSFFRDRAPFRRLRDEILPRLGAVRRERGIRVWSAGCATGQEPYSVAMIVAESAALNGTRVEILGADVSQRALERARSGVYSQFEVQRGVPSRTLIRHFSRSDETWTISPAVRGAVQWRRMNLNADFRALGQFDVILCRNVIKHMEAQAAARMLAQMAAMLAEDGALIIGAGESAPSLEGQLHAVEPGVLEREKSRRAAA
jgi:chemotaxis protein methyltransferase CheR